MLNINHFVSSWNAIVFFYFIYWQKFMNESIQSLNMKRKAILSFSILLLTIFMIQISAVMVTPTQGAIVGRTLQIRRIFQQLCQRKRIFVSISISENGCG